jgi:hypothetical protein
MKVASENKKPPAGGFLFLLLLDQRFENCLRRRAL